MGSAGKENTGPASRQKMTAFSVVSTGLSWLSGYFTISSHPSEAGM